ncbi:hypothetical protein QYF61_010491 [Mycteria americana]|uniref:C2 domain-containing protein n=1 Tax=Mycteria americana TaxID=33587 RepID=A0AAN7MXB5_MYCAM|nr:hypothetical protein QYF61_010491 [Mycteria americana]
MVPVGPLPVLLGLVAHRSGFTSPVADRNQEGCLTQAYPASLRAIQKCHFLRTALANGVRLISSQNEDKDGDSDNTISELPPTLQDVSPDRRRSSSDASRSTYSLTRRISSLESRRPSSPLIDIKPIEFGIIGAKKEIVQPTILRKTYTPDDYFRKFEPRLYSLDSNSDDMDSLTDEEILSKYQLGMLHFSTQYDLLHNYLIVRVIEAKDLPPPISYDGSRQDMAHSNPYVKICLLPDQKNSKQTGVKRKTQNPVFEERYTFEIPFLEAQRRTLLLTVVDFDKFSRHCVIGKVSMPLSDVDLVKGGHWWKALVPSSQAGLASLGLRHGAAAGSSNPPAIKIVVEKTLKQVLGKPVTGGREKQTGIDVLCKDERRKIPETVTAEGKPKAANPNAWLCNTAAEEQPGVKC